MYFSAATWDNTNNVLIDAKLNDLNPVVPIIEFIPTENYQRNSKDYQCPVYKTADRAGVLSTTGVSTNFVIAIDIPTQHTQDFFIQRGTAILLSLP